MGGKRAPGGGYFTKLPNVIVDDWAQVLTGGEFKVYCLIARLYNAKLETTVYMSHRAIAKQLNLHRNSVRQHLEKLTEYNLLRQLPCPGDKIGKHQHHLYVPTLPPPKVVGGTTIVLPVAQKGGTTADAELT